MLLTAKLGGELAIRVVVAELIAGIILGNLSFGGAALFDGLARNETIEDAAGAQMES